MTIAETMSQGFGIKEGKWSYLGGEEAGPVCIDESLEGPKTEEDAIKVLKIEAELRSGPNYYTET